MKTLNSAIRHKLETHCSYNYTNQKTPLLGRHFMPVFIKLALATFSGVIAAVGAAHTPLFTKLILANLSGVIAAVGGAQLLHFVA
jgi:hypothetical protein